MKMRTGILVALMGLLLVSCGADTTDDDDPSMPEEGNTTTSTADAAGQTTVPETRDPSRAPSTTTAPPVTGEVPDEILAEILKDATNRIGNDVEKLDVIRSEFVEWSDGSLGCPEPGEFYTQALVPGYWVEIETHDGVLDYRVTDSGNFKLCEVETPAGGSLGTVPTTMGNDS